MKLTEMQMKDYLDVLKSNEPVPGGGSASALAGAQGASLFMMVANLTIGKEKYAEFQEICKKAKEAGELLYEELRNAIDEDAEAFRLVSLAYKMPKETDEDKQKRSIAIAKATLAATEVPFKLMQSGYEGLKITEMLINKSNPNAASDLGVAALDFIACIKGAWLNVKINLPGIKEEDKRVFFKEEGEKICADAEKLSEAIYRQVLETL